MKYAFIQANQQDFSITTMCRILNIKLSSYYDWRNRDISEQQIHRNYCELLVRAAHSETKQRYGYDDLIGTLSGIYYSEAFTDNANTVEESADGGKGEMPAYTVWNFNLQKTIKDTDDEKLSLQFGVNNLLDEQYYFRGIDTSPVGRYPAPGRSYKLGVNYQF